MPTWLLYVKHGFTLHARTGHARVGGLCFLGWEVDHLAFATLTINLYNT